MINSVVSSGPTRIRRLNRKAVLSYIRHEGPHSRSALGRALSLSGAAISSVTNELVENGLLRESRRNSRNGQQGRPRSLLELNPESAYALGIVLRPSKTSIELGMAWVDYTGQATSLPDIHIDHKDNIQNLIENITTAIQSLEQKVPYPDKIVGVTIAVPGVVEKDSIPMAPKLQCIEGTTFIDELKKAISHPLSFQNDVNLAAISELHQQPRLRNLSFAYLYLYAGVGSSIAIQGKVHSGSGGWAGEIGALHINQRDPNSTSFERLLSTDGSLADLLETLGDSRKDLDKLAGYIDQRNPQVLKGIDAYCEHLCDAINVINSVLDLDEILIDFRSDKLFKRLRPRLEILLQSSPRQPTISTPVLGSEATLNGAAITALHLALDDIELAASN